MAATMTMLVSAIIQAVLFLIIPFVWWLITARRRQNFFRWLGWRRPRTANPGRLWGLTVLLAVLFAAFGLWLLPLFAGKTATSEFAGQGWAGLGPVIIYALLKTAFAEESLFRGFLLLRLSHRFGFAIGNTSQAVVFGLLHALPLGIAVGPLPGLLVGLFTGLVAAAIGYLDVKQADGSILPGWVLHAAANLLTGVQALLS